MVYDRESTYATKYVKITTLDGGGNYTEETVSLYDLLEETIGTDPQKLIDYAGGLNSNITGFANAADDAVQVLEFIHSSDMIVYNPHFGPGS